MLADWSQWLTNASALLRRSFPNTDRVRDAWDQASQPAYKAREFFVDHGIPACAALFPNGE